MLPLILIIESRYMNIEGRCVRWLHLSLLYLDSLWAYNASFIRHYRLLWFRAGAATGGRGLAVPPPLDTQSNFFPNFKAASLQKEH